MMLTLVPVALAALIAGADPGFDTVFLQNGGRLRGTVVEEDPSRGVTIQIPGGQVRTVPPAEIFRIEYRDGTLGTLGVQPPPPRPAAPDATAPPAPPAQAAPWTQEAPSTQAAPPAEPAPPAAGPEGAAEPPGAEPRVAPVPPRAPPPPGWSTRPPGEPVRPIGRARHLAPARPQAIMLAASLGFAAPGGSADPDFTMSEFTTTQFLLGLEGGLRLSPELMLGLYMDLGIGGAGDALDAFCQDAFATCSTASVRLGFFARYAFTPYAPQTAWIGIGTGLDVMASGSDDASLDTRAYGGWEPLRLSVGYDLRGTGQVGIGFFATLGLARYDEVDRADGNGFVDLPSTRSHTWFQAGVRFILFP